MLVLLLLPLLVCLLASCFLTVLRSACGSLPVLTAAERGVRLGQTARDGPVAVVPVDDVPDRIAVQRVELMHRHGVVPQPEVVDVSIKAMLTLKQQIKPLHPYEHVFSGCFTSNSFRNPGFIPVCLQTMSAV